MNASNNHLVIMAGGVGSRFWPMSTEQKPKQFIDVLGTGRTLLQMAYDRFKGLVPDENVWVVTNRLYRDYVINQLPKVPVSNILLEPCRRNTAPCIAYVSWRIKAKDPKANIVVTPSDHLITDTVEFQRVVKECLKFASETDAILTLGMKPNRPHTGYGYIEADLSSNSPRNHEIYRVDSFHEKPSLEVAQKYVSQDNFFWNAGIFIWNVETIVNAFRVYQPAMNKIFEGLLDIYGTDKEQEAIDRLYPECQKISVDYAIMEKAEEIFVCPVDFGWTDLGSWDSLHENTPQDVYKNSCIGPNIKMIDSRNCIVHTTQEKQVVIEGLDGYIVAENDGKLFVCRLVDGEKVKNFIGEE